MRHADGVHRIHVGDDLRVRDLVVEEESAEVGLRAESFPVWHCKGRVPYNDSIEKGRATQGEEGFMGRSRSGRD